VPRLQASEQYLTSSQTFAHFLRQAIGRPHCTQIFSGRFDFLNLGGVIFFATEFEMRTAMLLP